MSGVLDTQMGNVYDNDGRVLYLNGFHDNATEYVRCIVKPKAVFGTHTSLTTEQHAWLVPMPDGQSVRYSLLGRNRTNILPAQRLECSIEQHSLGETPASDDLRQARRSHRGSRLPPRRSPAPH